MFASLFPPFLLGCLVALAAGWLLIPILQRLKVRQFISTDAPKRHQTKAGTPTMGGAIILVGAVLPTLFFRLPSGDLRLLYAVLLTTVGFGLIGFIDDYLIITRGRNLGLRAREKLLGQFIVAIAFSAWFYMTYPRADLGVGNIVSVQVAQIALAAFHVLLLVGMSNAVNLTDGLDGLASGVSMPVWITLALLGLFGKYADPAAVSDFRLVAFCAAFAGATLGYLWYNAHPAQVFMGDTGSLAIGGGMAAAAIALRQEWVLILAAAVHVVEALSVIIQVISFKTTGKRVFKRSPLHHHFEEIEWPETRIVARFTLVSAMACLLALSLVLRTP
jgi:phospho-N-acetylmuramoyl-pentapeptide-transferase